MSRRNKKKIYSIILVNHGKRKKTICSEETEEKIYKKFNELLKENKNVLFPTRYNNEKHVMVESDYELVIIKCRELNDKTVTSIRDEYGNSINYETDDDNWVIVDRKSYDVEETFWVYGYHPKIQRKTFEWIFDSFIAKDAKDKYMFKSVQVYNNKVLIDCNGKLEMVICKTRQDAMRMYNMIENLSIKKKYKYIMFMGDVNKSKYKIRWMDRIQELTGWNRIKIKRRSTRD